MATDYSKFDGKKVTLKLTDAEEPVEGTIDTGNEMGVMFKPKGKAAIDLIFADKIESVEVLPEAPKKLTVKALLPLKDSAARQHLVDRHGYKMSDIEPMAEDAAFTFHADQVSHEGLAHNHDGKPKEDKPAAADSTDGEPAVEPEY